MTSPGRDEARGLPLTPARRGRDRDRGAAATEPPAQYDDADLQRGLAAAVLAAMGRMQLKLDAMARQHSEATAQLQAALVSLEGRLSTLEPLAVPVLETPPSPYQPPMAPTPGTGAAYTPPAGESPFSL